VFLLLLLLLFFVVVVVVTRVVSYTSIFSLLSKYIFTALTKNALIFRFC